MNVVSVTDFHEVALCWDASLWAAAADKTEPWEKGDLQPDFVELNIGEQAATCTNQLLLLLKLLTLSNKYN